MKKIVLFTTLVIVLGISWGVYLNHENKKFVESLPQPPKKAEPTVRVYADPKSGTPDAPLYYIPSEEVERLEELQKLVGDTENPNAENAQPQTGEEQPHHEHEHHEHEHEEQHEHGATPPQETDKLSKDASALSSEELYKKRGEFLRQHFGNVKEVDIVVKYLSKAENSGRMSLTPEEQIEFLKAVNFFWNTPENKAALERVLQEEKEK